MPEVKKIIIIKDKASTARIKVVSSNMPVEVEERTPGERGRHHIPRRR